MCTNEALILKRIIPIEELLFVTKCLKALNMMWVMLFHQMKSSLAIHSFSIPPSKISLINLKQPISATSLQQLL